MGHFCDRYESVSRISLRESLLFLMINLFALKSGNVLYSLASFQILDPIYYFEIKPKSSCKLQMEFYATFFKINIVNRSCIREHSPPSSFQVIINVNGTTWYK